MGDGCRLQSRPSPTLAHRIASWNPPVQFTRQTPWGYAEEIYDLGAGFYYAEGEDGAGLFIPADFRDTVSSRMELGKGREWADEDAEMPEVLALVRQHLNQGGVEDAFGPRYAGHLFSQYGNIPRQLGGSPADDGMFSNLFKNPLSNDEKKYDEEGGDYDPVLEQAKAQAKAQEKMQEAQMMQAQAQAELVRAQSGQPPLNQEGEESEGDGDDDDWDEDDGDERSAEVKKKFGKQDDFDMDGWDEDDDDDDDEERRNEEMRRGVGRPGEMDPQRELDEYEEEDGYSKSNGDTSHLPQFGSGPVKDAKIVTGEPKMGKSFGFDEAGYVAGSLPSGVDMASSGYGKRYRKR